MKKKRTTKMLSFLLALALCVNLLPVPAMAAERSADLPLEGMSATAGNSQPGEGPGRVLDGDASTLWHTDWNGTSIDNQWITINLGGEKLVDGLRYQPRQSQSNGTITDYVISVSTDGSNFKQVASGTWAGDSSWKSASFTEQKATHVKLKAVHTVADKGEDDMFASAAEIRITGRDVPEVDPDAPAAPTATTEIWGPTGANWGISVKYQCTNEKAVHSPSNHPEGTRHNILGKYFASFGEVYKEGDVYKIDALLNPDELLEEKLKTPHDGENINLTLVYKNSKWCIESDSTKVKLTLEGTCDSQGPEAPELGKNLAAYVSLYNVDDNVYAGEQIDLKAEQYKNAVAFGTPVQDGENWTCDMIITGYTKDTTAADGYPVNVNMPNGYYMNDFARKTVTLKYSQFYEKWECPALTSEESGGTSKKYGVAFKIGQEDLIVDEGQCGDNLYYMLTKDGILNIKGTGNMWDFTNGKAPWSSHNREILSVVIEEGATSIGNSAFYNCYFATDIKLPNTLTKIGKNAFEGDYKAVFTVPNSVTEIGERAFYSCRALTSVNIPEGVTTIGQYTFFGCSGLTNIVIPDSVTIIDKYAFKNCSALETVELGEGVTTIDFEAFGGCRKLQSMTFPASLTKIGALAFNNCTALKEIVFEGNAPKIDSSSFTGVTADGYYPNGDVTWTVEKLVNYGGKITWHKSAPAGPTETDTIYGPNAASWKITVDHECTNPNAVHKPSNHESGNFNTFKGSDFASFGEVYEDGENFKVKAQLNAAALLDKKFGESHKAENVEVTLVYTNDKWCIDTTEEKALITVTGSCEQNGPAVPDVKAVSAYVTVYGEDAKVDGTVSNRILRSNMWKIANQDGQGVKFEVGTPVKGEDGVWTCDVTVNAEEFYNNIYEQFKSDHYRKDANEQTTKTVTLTYNQKAGRWDAPEDGVNYGTASKPSVKQGVAFKLVKQYTVKFAPGRDLNGKIPTGTAPVDEKAYDKGEVVKMPAESGFTPSENGGVFMGWKVSVKESSSKTSVHFFPIGTDMPMFAADVTAEAYWMDVDLQVASEVYDENKTVKDYTFSDNLTMNSNKEVTLLYKATVKGGSEYPFALSCDGATAVYDTVMDGNIKKYQSKYEVYFTKTYTENTTSETVTMGDASDDVTLALIIDTEAPVIEGVEDGKIYCEDKTITITDEHLDIVTVDGVEVELKDGSYTLTEGTHEVVVQDTCGNETTITVTINDGHTFGDWIVDKEATCTEAGSKHRECSVCGETETEVIPATGHDFEDGECTDCGEEDPEYKDPSEKPEKPVKPEKPAKPDNSNDSDSPETGDNMSWPMMASLMIASLMVIFGCVLFTKKRRYNG